VPYALQAQARRRVVAGRSTAAANKSIVVMQHGALAAKKTSGRQHCSSSLQVRQQKCKELNFIDRCYPWEEVAARRRMYSVWITHFGFQSKSRFSEYCPNLNVALGIA
jgi:hypothetical protein